MFSYVWPSEFPLFLDWEWVGGNIPFSVGDFWLLMVAGGRAIIFPVGTGLCVYWLNVPHQEAHTPSTAPQLPSH